MRWIQTNFYNEKEILDVQCTICNVHCTFPTPPENCIPEDHKICGCLRDSPWSRDLQCALCTLNIPVFEKSLGFWGDETHPSSHQYLVGL